MHRLKSVMLVLDPSKLENMRRAEKIYAAKLSTFLSFVQPNVNEG